MDFLRQPSTSLPPALPETLQSEQGAGRSDTLAGHRDLWVASPLSPALTPTIPMTSPSCQLLIIALKKSHFAGKGCFVAQELICCCCSFPALNPNPQLGTPQLATAEPGTVSPRIRAPFSSELRDPASQWVCDGPSPPCSPRRKGTSLRDRPSSPPLGHPETCTAPVPPHQCHWVLFGVCWSCGPSADSPTPHPPSPPPKEGFSGVG